MNLLGFEAMTIGNHEYDWGEDAIRDNLAVAEFPFLAINIYDNTTGKLADYCTPSVMVERDGVQIGIIGAIGDCYSSISSDMVKNVHFKLGSELTSLVKAESERLRSLGADIIVYSIHDGGGSYDYSLSNGYVDVVFEGHSHSSYKKVDSYGVYHLQGGGENSGLSHVEIAVNYVSGSKTVNEASVVSTSTYSSLADHQPTEELESKYADLIRYAYGILGTASKNYSDSQLEDFVAQLYLEAGLERWGDRYNIVLGGGYLATRSPYDLDAGDVTYADLNLLFPFDNQIVLCSISGSNLKKKFINSTNRNYHIYLSEYGSSITISNNQTYYVIVDSYTATYSPNGLTIVDTYDETTYARDLLAKAIMDGRLNNIRTYASIFPSSVLGNIKEYYSVQKSMGDKSYAILCAKE
jgi:2',3'-cyclic-nucleotide 2'-phosphodiesterase/3'-nucleotidase